MARWKAGGNVFVPSTAKLKTCSNCGERFVAKSPTAKYCKATCRVTAFRRSQAAPDAACIEAALLSRGGMRESEIVAGITSDYPEVDPEVVMNTAAEKRFREFSLHDLVFASIEAAGQDPPSGNKVNSDTIRFALNCSKVIHATASPTSTVSLPGTLSRIANKQLLSAYEEHTQVWPLIAGECPHRPLRPFPAHPDAMHGRQKPARRAGR